MTAIFMLPNRNSKYFRGEKAEIARGFNRKLLTERKSCMRRMKKKNKVPDTAQDCPMLCIGVVHDQTVSEMENLWKRELFYFFNSLFLHHKTTVISIEI